MSGVPLYVFSLSAAIAAAALPARGQAVISTRAGVVHFFEGAVYVAGQPLVARPGKFAIVPEGGELRTEQGRAEVLLTPGVFLRLGEKSAIRMVANALPDTRVELVAGSAILDSAEPATGTSVTLIYKNWNIHQAQKGVCRIDSEPARLQVREGEAEVSAAGVGSTPVPVEQGMDLPFASVLVPEKSADQPRDTLTDWAEGRAESISADNVIASNIQDPATMTGPDLFADGFTYFPMLGLSSLGSPGAYSSLSPYQSGLYGSMSPYQSGFYSMYLPGYAYRPSLLLLPSSGLLRSTHSPYSPYSPYSPIRVGLPSIPVQRPIGVRPVTTPHPVLHPAVHVGGHK